MKRKYYAIVIITLLIVAGGYIIYTQNLPLATIEQIQIKQPTESESGQQNNLQDQNTSKMASTGTGISWDGIEMEYPKKWKKLSLSDLSQEHTFDAFLNKKGFVEEGNFVFKTASTPHSVFTHLTVSKTSELVSGEPAAVSGVTKVYINACGGPLACYILQIGSQKYSVIWDVLGDEPAPKVVDGIWSPSANFTNDDLVNILKGAHPFE